ncbi:MAG: GNAT family protein [Elusimicrobia bacterium]|nr:GNAT family protein [Elusimicrobiota bacterium]
MTVALREFREEDISKLDAWCRAIRSEEYMSNTRPKRHGDRKLLWRVILAEDRDAGAVWIEEADNRREAVLGILLGEPSLFGKGIGRAAIALALQEARAIFPFRRVILHVRTGNERAIACYKACRFVPAGKGKKTTADGKTIEFLTMEYLLR